MRALSGQKRGPSWPWNLSRDQAAQVNKPTSDPWCRRVVAFTCDTCGHQRRALAPPKYSDGVTFESMAYRGPCIPGATRGQCRGYGTWRVILRSV